MDGEKILGVIYPAQKNGLLVKVTDWSLFITNKRIIATDTLSFLDFFKKTVVGGVGGSVAGSVAGNIVGNMIGGAKNAAAMTGIGTMLGGTIGEIGAVAAMMNEIKTNTEKLESLNPDDILSNNKNNFEINYENVLELTFYYLSIGGSQIIIKTNTKKYTFMIRRKSLGDYLKSEKTEFIGYANLLKGVIGEKLKVIPPELLSQQ
jgi:hypothetical protein